jgi:hypothetical protein
MSYINPARNFPQKATYWAQSKQDGYGGETWVTPVIIACRWERITDETLSVAYKVAGETVVSRSVVFTETPLLQGAYLFLGETAEQNPSRLKGAYVIRSIVEIPFLDGTFSEYSSYL